MYDVAECDCFAAYLASAEGNRSGLTPGKEGHDQHEAFPEAGGAMASDSLHERRRSVDELWEHKGEGRGELKLGKAGNARRQAGGLTGRELWA